MPCPDPGSGDCTATVAFFHAQRVRFPHESLSPSCPVMSHPICHPSQPPAPQLDSASSVPHSMPPSLMEQPPPPLSPLHCTQAVLHNTLPELTETPRPTKTCSGERSIFMKQKHYQVLFGTQPFFSHRSHNSRPTPPIPAQTLGWESSRGTSSVFLSLQRVRKSWCASIYTSVLAMVLGSTISWRNSGVCARWRAFGRALVVGLGDSSRVVPAQANPPGSNPPGSSKRG